MRQLQFRGGLRVGWVNTSAPLVKLTVNHDELVIAGGLAGHFSFRPEDIIRLEPQTIFPVLGKRIKIIHRVPDYPEDIFFLTFRNPKNFIEDIRKTGFLTNINPVLTLEDERIIEQQKSAGGFPLKPLFALGLVILYHSGVLYYFISSGGNFRVEEMTHYFFDWGATHHRSGYRVVRLRTLAPTCLSPRRDHEGGETRHLRPGDSWRPGGSH
jgi:hypothetical protein